MLNIKKLLKGLRILNSSDQSKAVEVTISDAATTNTKTTLSAQQTANRTLILPDVSATLIGTVNNSANISGVSVNLTNTTPNKLLVAGASAGNSLIEDSSITHIDAVSTVTLAVTKDLILSSPNKEVTIDGKALRIPVVAFIPSLPPSGNQGDILFNPTSQSIWLCDNTGFYIEQISASGANRTLSNLVSPTSINQDLIPNGTKNLGNISNKFNATLGTLAADSATIVGNITADKIICNELDIIGSTTVINATTVDSLDPNITINKSGNNTTAQGAGITVDRVGPKGSLIYDSTVASRFKIGDLSIESEIMTVDTNQFISANKFFNGITSFGQTNANESGSNVTISATRNLLILSNASLVSIGKISYTAGINNVKGTIVNTLTTPVTLKHQINSGTTDGELYIPGAVDYILAPGASVTFNAVTSGLIRVYYFECKVDISRVGMIESFSGDIPNIPAGYLYCDGSILDTTTYPLLFNKMGNSWKKYNQTLASGKFVIPDLRGKFLRGATDRHDLTGFVIFQPTVLATQSGTGWSSIKTGDYVVVTGAGFPGGRFLYIDVSIPGSMSFYNTLSDCYSGVSPISMTVNGAIQIAFIGKDRDLPTRYGLSTTNFQDRSTVGSDEDMSIQAHTHRAKVLLNAVAGSAAATARPDGSFGNDTNSMIESTGTNETRPDNSAVLYIVKYLPDYN